MPYSPSRSWVMLTLLALLTLTSALDLDGIAAYMHHNKRQTAVGTGASSAAPSSTPASETPASSTPAPSSETPTPTPTPSSAVTSDAPTSGTPEPSSTPPAASSEQGDSSAPPTSKGASTPPAASSKSTKTSAQPSLYTSALVQTSVEQFVTVTTVVSGSSTFVKTETASRTVAHTTGFATGTSLPQSNDNGGSGGMSSKTKSIIGGVVGGIGGAILLGGLALVAWRVWGRKKRVSDDDNDLMMGTGSAVGEKPASGSQNTPFQTNLEQYHNPGGRPNAAANF